MAKEVAKNPDQLGLLPESTDRSFDADGHSLIDDVPFVQEEDFVSRRKIKVVDWFAGMGGFHYGIAAAAAMP